MVNSSKVDFLAHRALMKAVYGEVHPCGRLVQKRGLWQDKSCCTQRVLRPALSFPELHDLRFRKGGR